MYFPFLRSCSALHHMQAALAEASGVSAQTNLHDIIYYSNFHRTRGNYVLSSQTFQTIVKSHYVGYARKTISYAFSSAA